MKILKLLFINIIIFVILFFTLDYFVYMNYCYHRKIEFPDIFHRPKSYITFLFSPSNFGQTISVLQSGRYLKRQNIANSIKYTKPSIILFGGSYAYGSYLEENLTLGYKITNLTKRNVYNEAMEAGGIHTMNFILSNPDFYKKITPSPEYAIFVYIPNHMKRLTSNLFPSPLDCNNYIQYKLVKDELKLKNESKIFCRSFIIKKFLEKLDSVNNMPNKEQNYKKFMLANELFLESKKRLEEQFPNIKFVILKYVMENKKDDALELPFMWEVLKNEGFIIIDTKELLGREFKLSSEDTAIDNYHPSEKFIDELANALVKKLKL